MHVAHGADGKDEFLRNGGSRADPAGAQPMLRTQYGPVFQVARQRSLPLCLSRQATDSRMPLRSSDHAITTSSPATDGAPQPCPMGVRHSMGGPFVGHARNNPVSGEVPSPSGPWNCDQSAAEVVAVNRVKIKRSMAVRMLKTDLSNVGAAQSVASPIGVTASGQVVFQLNG